MSIRPDERIRAAKRDIEESESHLNMSKEKGDYCNLNIATFTFGGRGSQNLNMNSTENKDEANNRENQMKNNNFRKYNSVKKLSSCDNIDQNTKDSKSDQLPLPYHSSKANSESSSLSKLCSHNSFLYVVIHSFWNLKSLRNYFLKELSISEKDTNNKLLFELQSLIVKYSNNKIFEISKFKTVLAELFQNRRKFLIDQPDDPTDLFFALLNAIHSYSLVNTILFLEKSFK